MKKHKGTEPKFINKSEEELLVLLENLYKVRQKYYSECDPIYKEMEELGVIAGDYAFIDNVFARVNVRPLSVAINGIPARSNSVYVSFYREIIE